MTTGRRWILVSDTHFRRNPAADDHAAGSALARLVRHSAMGDASTTTVVLLGDFFELLNDVEPDANRALDAILPAHREVMDALRDAVTKGMRLVVVPGNHDAALASPEVWARFHAGFDDSHRVTLCAWFAYVPGVLYAEHGHQHHDLNRMPTLLNTRTGIADPTVPPMAAPGVRRKLIAFIESWRYERQSGRAAYKQLLREEAMRQDLPHTVVRSLHRISRFRPLQTVGRVLGVRFGIAGCRNENRARRQALKIAEMMDTSGFHVEAVVFGHTHRAEQTPVRASGSYLNTGTWTSDVRGGESELMDPGQFPYVEVTASGDRVSTELRFTNVLTLVKTHQLLLGTQAPS
ncbi:MAG TPA: metallophosphoesterase [Actinomycetes bacterium]|nr:metallophosphoesterase [Actinomycetes bacterium]